MATARELLAQADALMRRNRLREEVLVLPPAGVADFPILTEVVASDPLTAPGLSAIDLEQAIDVAELETEAAVAAATDAALAREAASSGKKLADTADIPDPTLAVRALEMSEAADAAAAMEAIDAAVTATPAPWLDSIAPGEGPEPTSAVAARETAPPVVPLETVDVAAAPVVAPEEAVDTASVDAMPVAPADTAADRDDEFPMLTDVVDDVEPISILGVPEDANDASAWAEFDRNEALIAETLRNAQFDGPVDDVRDDAPLPIEAPEDDPVAVEMPLPEHATTPQPAPEAGAALPAIAPVALTAAFAPTSPFVAAPAADAGASDAARWNALAEEIRMQVLQRIDIFTDTGLQEQLAARLQPIVDRASADLVATINQQVGQLLRAYVAEAIEREIDRWREDGR